MVELIFRPPPVPPILKDKNRGKEQILPPIQLLEFGEGWEGAEGESTISKRSFPVFFNKKLLKMVQSSSYDNTSPCL